MAHLTPAQLKHGVICASAGNHAEGVALGASELGCPASLFTLRESNLRTFSYSCGFNTNLPYRSNMLNTL
jgi:threonine dehydratase